MNSLEKAKMNKELTARIKEMLKEIKEVNTEIDKLTVRKTILGYEMKGLTEAFEEINGFKWNSL